MKPSLSVSHDTNELVDDAAGSFGVEDGWEFGIIRDASWSDLDAYGHVNNLAYLEWCQEARTRYFRHLMGVWPGEADASPVVRSVEFTYEKALALGDRVLVTVRTAEVGRTSCVQHYAIWRDGPIGRGRAVCVFMSRSLDSKMPVPEAVRQSLFDPERVERKKSHPCRSQEGRS